MSKAYNQFNLARNLVIGSINGIGSDSFPWVDFWGRGSKCQFGNREFRITYPNITGRSMTLTHSIYNYDVYSYPMIFRRSNIPFEIFALWRNM